MTKRRFRLPADRKKRQALIERLRALIPLTWILEGEIRADQTLIGIGTALADAYQIQYPDGRFELHSFNVKRSPVQEMRVRMQTSSTPLFAGTIHFQGIPDTTLKHMHKVLGFYLDLGYEGHLLFAHRVSKHPADEVTSCYIHMQDDAPIIEICSNLDSPDEIVELLNLCDRFELPPA